MSFKNPSFEGRIIIITAPSGAGKTTIVRHLLNRFDILDFSISATTREKRDTEKEGVDYFFKTPDEFRQLIEDEELVEWEEVYTDKFYGTLRSEIDRIWQSSKHIVFDIDVQGAMNLQRQFPHESLSIFVKPPSLEVLISRLKNRKTESVDSLKKRIQKAKLELSFESMFDITLINDDLKSTLQNSEKIILSYIFDKND